MSEQVVHALPPDPRLYPSTEATPEDLAWRAQVCAQSLSELQDRRKATEAQAKALIQRMKDKLKAELACIDGAIEGEQENLRFLLAERKQREGKTIKLLTDRGDWAEVSFRAWPTQGQRDGKRWRITGWDEQRVIDALQSGEVEAAYGILSFKEVWSASKTKALEWFLKTGEILPGVQIEEDTRPDQVSVEIRKPEITDGSR